MCEYCINKYPGCRENLGSLRYFKNSFPESCGVSYSYNLLHDLQWKSFFKHCSFHRWANSHGFSGLSLQCTNTHHKSCSHNHRTKGCLSESMESRGPVMALISIRQAGGEAACLIHYRQHHCMKGYCGGLQFAALISWRALCSSYSTSFLIHLSSFPLASFTLSPLLYAPPLLLSLG